MGYLFLAFCKICAHIHAASLNPKPPEIAYLRQEINRLSAANRIMKQFIRKKKLKPSFLIKLKLVVFTLMFRVPLRRIHCYLPVTRSTIRRYIAALRTNLFKLRQQSNRPLSSPHKTPAVIAALVRKIKLDNPTWGYLRIAVHLLRLQAFLAPSTVRRILLSPPPAPSPGKSREHDIHKKIVVAEPNRLWSLDLTTVHILGIFPVYILGVIDHFSRKVFCLTSTPHPTAEWAVHELKTVFSSFGVPRAIITDNGSIFASGLFRSFLVSQSAAHIRTAVRHPQTNGKIERFFQSLKHEFLCLFFLTSKRRLDGILTEYLFYYNRYRLHEAIEGQAPDDVHSNRRFSKPDRSAKHIRAPIEEIRMGNGLLRAYRLKQAA